MIPFDDVIMTPAGHSQESYSVMPKGKNLESTDVEYTSAYHCCNGACRNFYRYHIVQFTSQPSNLVKRSILIGSQVNYFLTMLVLSALINLYAPVILTLMVRIMTCRLAGAKPLSEPMLEYCQLDPSHMSNQYWPVGVCVHVIKSPVSRLFSQPFIQCADQRNIKAPRHWPLWVEKFIGYQWFAAQRASNGVNVSIWWCHHERVQSLFKMSFKLNIWNCSPISQLCFRRIKPRRVCSDSGLSSARRLSRYLNHWRVLLTGLL